MLTQGSKFSGSLALVLLVGCGLPTVLGMDIISPPELASSHVAMLHSKYLGPQYLPRPLLAPLSFQEGPVVETTNCARMNQTIAIVTDPRKGKVWDRKTEQGILQTVENCGAIAVIRPADWFGSSKNFLGAVFFTFDFDCCRSSRDAVSIPVLTAWGPDLLDVRANTSIHVLVNISHIDPNPFAAHHWLMSFSFYALVPILNLGAALFSLVVLKKQRNAMHNYLEGRATCGKRSIWHSVSAIQITCILQFLASTNRVLYSLLGPHTTESYLTWRGHSYLVTISIVFEILVITVLLLTARRVGLVGSVANTSALNRKAYNMFLGMMCLGAIIVEFIASYRRAERVPTADLATSGVLSAIIVAFASIAFLYFGRKFLKQLDLTGVKTDKSHSQRHFTVWLMFGTGPQLLSIATLSTVVWAPDAVLHPVGFRVVLTLSWTLIACATICYLVAFNPPRFLASHKHTRSVDELTTDETGAPTSVVHRRPERFIDLDPIMAAFYLPPPTPVGKPDPRNVQVVNKPQDPECYATEFECVI